ncbi:MAG: universal stress protein [Chloroflexota bacterium]
MLSSVLVPLDGSPLAERALPYATALAGASRAKLHLIRSVVTRLFPGPHPEDAQLQIVQEAENYLADLVNRLKTDDLVITPHVYLERPAVAILDAAKRQSADLIVMSTHGRGGLGRWIYGSVADWVLREAQTPILLVPAGSIRAWQPDRSPKVLLPLDGSDLAESTIATLNNVAPTANADLVLLRVIEPPTYPIYGDGYAYIPFDEEAERQDAQNYLDRVAERLKGQGYRVSSQILVGTPSSTIPAVARDEGVDCVAMTTHGYGGLTRLVMGSVVTGVVQQSPAPLLLTRPLPKAETAPSQPAALTEPLTLSLTAQERTLLAHALQALLTATEKDEHLTAPIQALLDRVSAQPRS